MSLTKAIFISTIVNYIFIQINCVIPSLTVKKVDRKFIERKRQDTLEICRLFNEENNLINKNKKSNVNNEYSASNRIKRYVDLDSNNTENSVFKQEDILRVEKIVDKMYEDLEDIARNVTYRQRILKNITKGINTKLNRRFNFAPAQLLGPSEVKITLESTTEPIVVEEGKILWAKKWAHGILPYFIDRNTYDSHLSDIILKAFDYIEKVSCIRLQRLREKPLDKHSLESVAWLYITNPSGIRQCVHTNERKPNTGVQMVVLGYDCLSQGEIAHEIMHVLGFSHEHTRPDRDRYITILWENIKPGYKKYFTKRHDDPLINLPYDYASVLHYPPRAFSKNGQITVMAQSDIKFGQREALSELDVEKIGIIYGRECVDRNKDYLLKTCPSVVKVKTSTNKISKRDIEEYFKDRIWPYGIVNYQIKDKLEFTTEERDNIKAVLNHIEKETCIEFRDINDQNDVGELNNVNLASNLNNILHEYDTSSDEYKRRYHKVNDKAKRKNNKQTTKIKKTVLPKSPARRHAANVLTLVRSTKPGCQCPPPGRPNGNKELIINADCFNSENDLLHLFVHLLGLDHQHKMHDRDSFLHIEWGNLTPEITAEIKEKLPPAASAGFAYDYQSVMHYPWLRIKDGVTNIMYPIWNDGWAMGHWQGLSWVDMQKLHFIYTDECEKRKKHIRHI